MRDSPVFTESLTLDDYEACVQSTAARVTQSQYKAATQLLEEANRQNFSQARLIQEVCILMALSFREGIHLAIETYGLDGSANRLATGTNSSVEPATADASSGQPSLFTVHTVGDSPIPIEP